MFDLITGQTDHIPRRQTVPMLLSIVAEVGAVALIAAASIMVATNQVPKIPSMMAFVAAPPAPAPPPPPPPPPAPRATPPAARPVPTTGALVTPVEVPSRIEPEPGLDAGEEGVEGGVEGGVPGGVLEGIVGGLPADTPPPPPPPPPAPRGPVRVGGDIKMPTLLHRVEPVYPPFALAANLQGTVILEAVVDEEGRVQDVKVLRSQGLLDPAAIAAVRQWRYSPVLLNGRPVKFVLTVVLTFSVQQK